MILGIGTDLCRIDRIEKALTRFGDRFTHRVFLEGERARAEARANRAASYARRFAAKEACAKALGMGLRMNFFWREIEVINAATGRPGLRLHGRALARLAAMTPRGEIARLMLSLTDDPPHALAVVIVESLPE